MAEFNQIPVQCEKLCELTQEDVDRHGIVLSLNCDGPSVKGDEYKDSLKVRNGEVVDVDYTTGSTVGRIACTNRGVNLWAQDRKAAFEAVELTDLS